MILSEYLHRTPVSNDENEWPSPETLARKILVKGKKITVEKNEDNQIEPSAAFYDSEEDEDDSEVAEELVAQKKLSYTSSVPPGTELTNMPAPDFLWLTKNSSKVSKILHFSLNCLFSISCQLFSAKTNIIYKL